MQPVGALSRLLIDSSSGSVPSMLALGTPAIYAAERARLIFGCYRRGDANDPETYTAAIAAVLAEYPPDIVMRVSDPRTGMASRCQFLPTLKELRNACEEAIAPRRRQLERQCQIAKQLARRDDEKPRDHRLSYDELRQEYGPNWGLKPIEDEEIRAVQFEQIREANTRLLARELEMAGGEHCSGSIPVSPTLRKMLQARQGG